MNQNLTDKTYCVLLKSGYKTYLTRQNAEELSKAFEAGKEVARVVDGDEFKTFFKFGVDNIMPAWEIQRDDKIKRGEWQCEKGFWHGRNEQCGHRIIPGM
jgi:hypothetical protein